MYLLFIYKFKPTLFFVTYVDIQQRIFFLTDLPQKLKETSIKKKAKPGIATKIGAQKGRSVR